MPTPGKTIKKKKLFSWTPKKGQRLKNFEIEKLQKTYNITQPESLKITDSVIDILKRSTNPKLKNKKSVTGLVFGGVQSGKTMSFTSLAIAASENGYDAVLVLVGTKNNLAEQNKNRLKKDLGLDPRSNYDWYHEHEPKTHTTLLSQLNDPSDPTTLLITCKKLPKILSRVKSVLDQLKHKINSILIIDDEADQASLDTTAGSKSSSQSSATYRSIVDLRDNCIKLTSYIQYTATPQAPIFISTGDVLSPNFVHILSPGTGYTGSEVFFKKKVADVINVIPGPDLPKMPQQRPIPSPFIKPPPSLIEGLFYFYVGVADAYVKNKNKRPNPDKTRSMLIHPHTWTWTHDDFENFVKNINKNILTNIIKRNKFDNRFLFAWKQLKKNEKTLSSYKRIEKVLYQVINQTIIEKVNSSKGTSSFKWDSAYSFIIIGGSSLDRGFTVEGLTVTYMPRPLAGGQVDTLQQRCRFFGYRNSYLDYCKVYLPAEIKTAYTDYFDHIQDLKKIIEDFYKKTPNAPFSTFRRVVKLSRKLKLTRKGVLSYLDNFKRLNLNTFNEFNDVNPNIHKRHKKNKQLVDLLYKSIKNQLKLCEPKIKRTDNETHKYVLIDPLKNKRLKDLLIDYTCEKIEKSHRFNYLSDLMLDVKKICVVIMNEPVMYYRYRTWRPNISQFVSLFGGRRKRQGLNDYKGDQYYQAENLGCADLFTLQIHTFSADKKSDPAKKIKGNSKDDVIGLAIQIPKWEDQKKTKKTRLMTELIAKV